ncbi:MAG TPA: conjugal transfer protein TraF [Vicinamibacterales bacterium]|nr:conjugal transfer protein TraF [Vicinamibacterales bacterium]
MSEFGATFGQSITQHFVVGTTVKVVNALNDTKADLDVGALVAFGFVRVGVTVRDVLEPTFGVAPDAFELTRRARAGAAFIASAHGWVDRAVFAVDADLTTSPIAGRDERELAGGAELWMRGRRIGVRGGGGTNTAAGGGSFGAFGLTLVPFPRLNVDGAVQRGSDSTRDRWSLGVRLTF